MHSSFDKLIHSWSHEVLHWATDLWTQPTLYVWHVGGCVGGWGGWRGWLGSWHTCIWKCRGEPVWGMSHSMCVQRSKADCMVGNLLAQALRAWAKVRDDPPPTLEHKQIHKWHCDVWKEERPTPLAYVYLQMILLAIKRWTIHLSRG